MELTLETLERHWLPFSDNRGFKREPRLFVSASGMYYCEPGRAQDLGRQLRTVHHARRPLPA